MSSGRGLRRTSVLFAGISVLLVGIGLTPASADSLTFTADSPATHAAVGTAYSYTFASNDSGAHYGVYSGAVPTGMSFDGTTGVLSGVPTTAGTYTFAVQVDGTSGFAVVDGANNTIVVSGPGSTFIADTNNSRILEVPAGGGGPIAIVTGITDPENLAVDQAGDIYVVQPNPGTVTEIPADGRAPLPFSPTIAGATRIAVDAVGNVYTSEPGTSTVTETFADGSGTQTLGSGLGSPNGLAVDAAGDLFIVSADKTDIFEIPAAAPRTQKDIGSSLADPVSISVDQAGDTAYVGEAGPDPNVVERVPLASGTGSQLVGGMSGVAQVAADGSGNVVIADAGDGNVVKVPEGGGSASTVASGLNGPHGVAVFAPDISFTLDTPPTNGTVESGYVYQFGASGPATFSVINGSIPDGLQFDATGDLSGSPLTPGNYTFNVLAKPQGGVLGGIVSPPINIVINDPGSGVTSLSIFYAVPQPDGVSFKIGGLLVGTPNTDYDGSEGDPPQIAIDAQGSCNDEGATVDHFSVTTDANGVAYFARDIDTDPLDFVPHLADYSFWGNCYPVGPDNTSWSNASGITLQNGVGTGSGYIGVSGESRWYKFSVTPDSSVTVTLSGLTTDDALAVYGDIGAAVANPATTPLDEQAAEQPGSSFSPSAFSPSAFSPSAFSPSAFSPSAFSPSAFSPSAFSPSAFSPSAFSPSAFSPSAFSPSAFSPSAFSPSAFSPSAFSPSAFSAAGFTPSAFSASSYSPEIGSNLIGFSDDGGNANKSVTVNTWSNTGSFYVAVAGRDGAIDPDVPFTVTVNDGSGSCSPSVVPQGSAPANVAAQGVKTVLLTDSGRVAGSTSDKSFMLSELQAVAARPEVAGTVIDLASNSRVQGLQAQADANPNCPFAENLVAGAIRDIVNSYRANNPLTYVVLAGGDSSIPFFRHPDQTLIGNESGYVPPLADQTPAQAALRLGYVLSDNDYGAKTTLVSKTDSYPVPDLAVGRLVESASEISGQLANYVATNGVVPAPKSSLVTGYDFLSLPANQVETNLTAGIGTGAGTTNDTLIQPDGDAPANSWNSTQLANKLLNSGRHDVVFLSGHFSANDTLAADYATDVITTQMEQSSVNLTNSLVFSPGCHSGYNIPDSEALPGVTLTLDWPQEFARKGAIFIGGTGYQYGDTDFVAYSEQIDVNLSHNLLLGTGAVSIGQALLKAKQDYLTSQSTLGSIPQKAVLEAEMYGLPMEGINMPNGRIPTTTATSSGVTPTASATDPGKTLGLTSANVTVTSSLTEQTKQLTDITDPGSPTVNATYYTGGSGVSANAYEPVLPLESKNVTVTGSSLRGVLFTGGHYSDESGVTPLVSAPTTETGAVHTGFSSSVYYPQQPYSVNQLGALDGSSTGAGTTLYVTPAQHISDANGTTDTRRTYSDTSYKLFYLGNGSTVAQSAAPSIVDVNSQIDPNDPTKVDVCADLGGNPTAGIQEAVVTWSDASKTSGEWQSEDITSGGCDANFYDAGGFGGTISLGDTNATDLRFMVQAVNGVGLVTVNNNLGAYFALPSDNQSFPDRTSTITKFTETTTNAPYGTSETLSAALNDDNEQSNPPTITPIAGETLTFKLGTQTATAVTGDDGVATATFPLNIAPGTYTPSASFGGNDDDNPSSGQGDPVTVTKQVSHLDLAVTSGTLPVGDTSYTVTLCSTSGSSCGTTDPLLTQKTVVMQLSGPVTRTTTIQTGGAGTARFDAYGLPQGSYTLKASFGAVDGVTAQGDPYYGDTSASTGFRIAASSTTPPTLTVPANISVPQTSSAGAIVSFTASATDPVDPRPTVSCNPGSVSLFPTGSTTVSCTATDSAGNTSAAKTFSVTVTAPNTQAPAVLQYSGTADRAGAANLTGSTVSGNIYVFATVPANYRSVVFSLDGKAFHSEATAPFDFNGTAAGNLSTAFSTTSLTDGSHTISAVVTSDKGVVTQESAAFTVANNAPVANAVLQVSTSASRQPSVNLDGSTVSGSVYVFADVPTNDQSVVFMLDGKAFHTEASAPFDFNGTAAGNLSTAFATTSLTNGTHTIGVTILDAKGASSSALATFTVNNASTPPPALTPLQVSTHADRSSPVNLDGSTLTGTVYIFDVPTSAAYSVQFSLDGKAFHSESTAPYDFNGSGVSDALPYSLTPLSKGKHTVTAVTTLTTGKTTTQTSTFTVT